MYVISALHYKKMTCLPPKIGGGTQHRPSPLLHVSQTTNGSTLTDISDDTFSLPLNYRHSAECSVLSCRRNAA